VSSHLLETLLIRLLLDAEHQRPHMMAKLSLLVDIEQTYFNVLVVETRGESHPKIGDDLRAEFGDSIVLELGSRIALLEPSALNFSKISPEYLEKLERILESHGAVAATSGNARELGAIDVPFAIACHILAASSRTSRLKPKRIYTQDEHGIYYIFSLLQDQFVERFGREDPLALLHPGVVTLLRYDREHRTDLSETLFLFLANDRNLKVTATRMFTHRNTIYNKMKKIREIIGSDLDDSKIRFNLQFSHLLLSYLEEIRHAKI